jgi:hypothetical protein
MDEITVAESYFNGEDAADLLPAWFVTRMMEESGSYGLLLNNGVTLGIERIERLHRAKDGSLWLDVVLCPRPTYAADRKAQLFYAPGEAQEASVNVSQIALAFDLGGGG